MPLSGPGTATQTARPLPGSNGTDGTPPSNGTGDGGSDHSLAIALGIGCGVGIPLATAIAAGVWFFVWRKRRRDMASIPSQSSSHLSPYSNYPESRVPMTSTTLAAASHRSSPSHDYGQQMSPQRMEAVELGAMGSPVSVNDVSRANIGSGGRHGGFGVAATEEPMSKYAGNMAMYTLMRPEQRPQQRPQQGIGLIEMRSPTPRAELQG
jgi:hypothetical protein